MSLNAQEEPTLSSLVLEFDVRRAELGKPLLDLQTKYEERLNQLLVKATSKGELKKALAVKAEIEGGNEGGPKQADVGFPELKRLQNTYTNAYAQRFAAMNEKLGPLVSIHEAKLEALQMALTKEGRIDEALAVKTVIDGLKIDTLTDGDAVGEDPDKLTTKSLKEVDPKNENEFRNFLLSNEFVFFFDPPRNKVVTFNEDGRIGKGGNSWEFAWKIVKDELHTFSSNEELIFAFDLKKTGALRQAGRLIGFRCGRHI